MDKTTNAVAVFDNFADEYFSKFMNVDLYSKSLDLFCELVTKSEATILELACGPGNITKYLLDKRPDFKIVATDLSPKMLAIGAVQNPNAEFQLLDCRDVAKQSKEYDSVICGFGLPYLDKKEVLQFIADAYKTLNTNGILYISTMEDDYSKSKLVTSISNPSATIFIHYHESEYLLKALNTSGFRVIETERKKYIHNGAETTDLIIIAQKLAH